MLLRSQYDCRKCLQPQTPGLFQSMLTVDATVAPDRPVGFREIRDEITEIRCDFCDYNGAVKIRCFHMGVFFVRKRSPNICWNTADWLRILFQPFQYGRDIEEKDTVLENFIA